MSAVPQPDYGKSVEFLQWWRKGGPWNLTAIGVDQKTITTAPLYKRKEIETWLAKEGKKNNIYFLVNSADRPLNKKASRADIKSMDFLHVDIDPRVGEDIAEEQRRALKLLQDFTPRPSCIVFSGGGYQGFWRLKEPVPINGQEDLYEDAKRYNLQLEITLGADQCHNVDRIMRLPGTLNRPDERKRKKGRVTALAYVVEFTDLAYDISEFTKAPVAQQDGAPAAGRHGIVVSDNIKRLASVDELPSSVPPRCKVIIVQGLDPNEPNKHPSRSEWLFYVCCELVRAGCDDDIIYSIITDPDFLISASVLELGGRAKAYALHQIERARDHAIDPDLQRLNDQHAVIGDIGGKCRIISEVHDLILNRWRINYQSFADFRNRYDNRSVEFPTSNGKVASVPLGKWWIGNPNRREYETITFAPGQEVTGAYNLWRGFAYDARPGDCSLFLEHVKNNICGKDEGYYNYLMGWLANAVQHPEQQGHTAIVLRGQQGTGKSFFAKTFGALFGQHFIPISDPKHLVGSFNAHLRDCVVLFGDEAFYAGDKKHESILKMLITEELMAVEKKSIDVQLERNCLHIIMASNSEWVVPAGVKERRFFVLDVGTARLQDRPYFAKVQRQMSNGGYGALLHLLLTHDLTGFDVRGAPQTDALTDQKVLSLSGEEEWWYQKLRNGDVFEGEGWPKFVASSHLAYDFIQYVKAWSGSVRSSQTRLGIFLKSHLPACQTKQRSGTHTVVQTDGTPKQVTRPKIYIIPPLQECRDYWDEVRGAEHRWPVLEEADLELGPGEYPAEAY